MQTTLLLLLLLSSGLSVVGGIAVLFVLWQMNKHPTFSFSLELLGVVTIVDSIAALQHFIPTYSLHSPILCTLQGSLNQFFFLSSFLWIACFSHSQFKTIVKGDLHPQKYRTIYHLIGWSFPLVSVATVSSQSNGFTDDGLWCWISQHLYIERFVFFYIPMLIVFLWVLYAFIRVYKALGDQRFGVNAQRTQSAFEMSLYLIAFVVIRTPSLVHRVIQLFYKRDVYVLVILHALCSPLQGFVNSLLFWHSSVVKRFWKRSMRFIEEIESSVSESERGNDFSGEWHEKAFDLFIGTWNMGKSGFEDRQVDLWIKRKDVIVIGVQECTDVNWYLRIESILESYDLLVQVQLRWMKMAVFIRKGLSVEKGSVKVSKEASGVGNMFGNKGAVAVSFSVCGTLVAFVNCHLAAHSKEIRAREEDFKQILSHLGLTKRTSGTELCDDFDCFFVLGDLNYRIQRDAEYISECIRKSQLNRLLKYDQLLMEKKKGNLFIGLEEMEVTFPPTFKVCPGEQLQYNDKRRPAWCDRILFKCKPFVSLFPSEYQSQLQNTTSDHKPVSLLVQVSSLTTFDLSKTPLALEFVAVCFRPFALSNAMRDLSLIAFSDVFPSPILFEWNQLKREHSTPPVAFEYTRLDILLKSSIYLVLRDSALFGDDNLIGSACLSLFNCEISSQSSMASLQVLRLTQLMGTLEITYSFKLSHLSEL